MRRVITDDIANTLFDVLIPQYGVRWKDISRHLDPPLPTSTLATWWKKVKTTERGLRAFAIYLQSSLAEQTQTPLLMTGAPATKIVEADLEHPYVQDLVASNPDPDVWSPVSCEVRKWDSVVKEEGEAVVKTMYHGKVKFVENKQATDLKTLGDKILEDIKKQSTHTVVKHKRSKDRTELIELAPFDVHWGKLAWGQESGADYDTDIASSRFRRAVSSHLENVASRPRSATVLLIVGQDAMHFDTMSGLTTAGTPQDMDSRYHRVFRRMRADYSWAIRECVKVLPTRVMVVPGNHDQLAAFHLGEVLAAEFDDHAFVSIDNDPKLRKYVEWGTVLLGFTHGRFENIRNLPGIMATEMREAWGRTSVHEFHIGHWHTKRQREWKSIEECDGAVVRTLPALTGPDHWHYTHGFITSRQACECYIWDRKDGYVGHFSWNVPLEESVK